MDRKKIDYRIRFHQNIRTLIKAGKTLREILGTLKCLPGQGLEDEENDSRYLRVKNTMELVNAIVVDLGYMDLTPDFDGLECSGCGKALRLFRSTQVIGLYMLEGQLHDRGANSELSCGTCSLIYTSEDLAGLLAVDHLIPDAFDSPPTITSGIQAPAMGLIHDQSDVVRDIRSARKAKNHSGGPDDDPTAA